MRPKKFLVSQIPIFYTLWLVSWFFNFSLYSFFLFIIHFSPLFFFPSLCLQLPIPPASPITSSSDCIPTLSLFISFTVSARAFQVPEDFFIFNHFLLYCLSACHCLCLTQPPLLPAMGKSLFLFSVLTNSCPWNFFFSSVRQSINILAERSLEILFKNEVMENQKFWYFLAALAQTKTQWKK